jgi:pimeloyl-ACP methyl ester carboxylesterase
MQRRTVAWAVLAGSVVGGALWAKEAPPVVGTVPSADGVPIRYEVRGTGKPALVFVHCWCCDRRYWEQQLPHFAKTHKVVAIDLAGHGESGLERSEWGPVTYGQDVKAVVDRLKLDDMILIGHSMGGPVSAQAALLLGGRVRALVGIDTFVDVERKPSAEEREGFLAPMRADFAGATEGFIRGMMFPPTADPALVDRIAKDMAQGPANVGIVSMEAMLKQDLPAVLKATKLPVYCVNADKFPTNVEAGQRHALLFKARILPGVGHFLQLEKPGEFNKLLGETIAEIESRK